MATSNFRDQGLALTELNKLALELIDIEKYSDVRALLSNIASSAKEVLKADLIELYEYNQDHDRYKLPPIRAGERLEKNVPKVKIYQDDAVWKLIHHPEPLYREKAQDEIIFTADYDFLREDIPADRFVIREKIQSTAVIPLRAEKKSMGLMFANYRKTQSFDKEQRELIELFAKQAAIAIKNARLFQQINTQTQALTELNKLTHRLVSVEEYSETSDLLKRIAESAKEVLKADLVDLYEYRQNNKEFKLPQISVGERRHPSILKDKIYEDDTIFQLIDSSEPLYVKDTQSVTVFTAPYTFERKGKPKERFVDRENILSAAVVPLRTGTESMGLMFVNYRTPKTFPKDQQELIELFANQAAITIKNSRLFQQRRYQAQALTELSQIAYNLLSIEKAPSTKNLLERIAESAREVLQADVIELYEYRQDQNKYELPPISKGEIRDKTVLKNEIFQDDAVFQLIHKPEPFYEKNSQAKSSIFTAPYTIKRENLPAERFVVREGIDSTAAIPLRTADESMGLMFANYRIPQSFPKEQQELIELFANQAAIAIKNFRLYYYVNQRREALVKIGQKLTAGIHLQEDEIYELVYEQASEMLGFENLSIALFDKSTDTVKFVLAIVDGRRVNIKQEPGWEPRQGGKGKTERIIQSKEHLLLPTLEEVKKTGFSPIPGHKDYEGKLANSWLGVPMFISEEVLGVLATYHYGQDYFYNEDDIEILQALANQAAIAIENARLYYKLNQRQKTLTFLNQRQKALVEIGQKLTAGIRLREDEILELIYENATQLLNLENFSIALYDETTDSIRFALATLFGRRVDVERESGWEPRQGGIGKTGQLIRTKKPLLLRTQDEVRKAGFSPVPGKKDSGNQIANSWLGVPMIVSAKIIGVIAVEHYGQDNYYNEDDVKVLQVLANQAAIAIDNARLYYEVSRRNYELNRLQKAFVNFGSQLTSKILLGEAEILNFIHGQAERFMDTNNMYIALYDKKTNIVRFGLAVKDGKQIDIQPRKGGKGRTEEIIYTGKPIFIATRKDAEEWYKQPGREEYIGDPLASWIGVPMRDINNEVIGVVATFHPTNDHVYSKEDQDILQSMADLAAIALENSRLHQEKIIAEKREAEQWSYLGRIAGSLAHRIGNKGGMIRVSVQDLAEHIKNENIVDEIISKELDIITRNNQYLLSLSEFLFKPQKAVKEGLEETDIVLYLKDALKYAEIPSEVSVVQEFQDDLPCVRGNKYLVEAFLELIVNAVEAMLESKEKKLLINAYQKENHVEIKFVDTGRGFKTEDEDSVFELFSASTNKRLSREDHHGFGLWWVSTFLRDIGGKIRYERPPHQGAIFIVELALVENKDEK